MSIKLDWEIEAEQSHVRQSGEDPDSRRRRRLALVRFFVFVVIVVAILGGVAAGLFWRVRQIDAQIEQLLHDTVDAEVAALRIGDLGAFLSHQRSATDDWNAAQEAFFDAVQTAKTRQDVQLTGRILASQVDGQRGRVQVEEIIDGVPYARTWFYWNYDEDGWRHVPPDYTFWGDAATLSRDGVTVRYRTVDAPLAQPLADALAGWLRTGCAALGCETPQVQVELIPDETLAPGWADVWTLHVPSPFAGQARLDQPFSPLLQRQLAALTADRLVSTSTAVQPVPTADAAFLRASALAWLADSFVGAQTTAYLIDSLASTYGVSSIGALLRVLQPTSEINVLTTVTGTATAADAPLDWRDFVTWRLNVEAAYLESRDEIGFLTLYDTGDENARLLAYARFGAGGAAEPHEALVAVPEVDANGIHHLRAQAQVGAPGSTRQFEVIFRLVNGVWRRAN